ncbi:MAG: hypothetical protein ACRDRS_21125 [Pseudonocardiaceae bacterium]
MRAHPVSGAPRWGVSSLDYRAHAIDPGAEHPVGVWVAYCGQMVFPGATLYEEPPLGGVMCRPCERCQQSLADAPLR